MIDGNSYETIQLENSQFRIPSKICTEWEIFKEIFSIDTWNNILSSDQKQRILKVLPKEVQLHRDLALKTIEDFFGGGLCRFEISPLNAFFNDLNSGEYDPEVIHIKSKINREWRRDLLLRKKSYHTKLVQNIIISSDACLKQFHGKKVLKANGQTNLAKTNKETKLVGQKETISSKRKNSSMKASPLRQKIAKKLHHEIAALNQSFSTNTTLNPLGTNSNPKVTGTKKLANDKKSLKSNNLIATSNEKKFKKEEHPNTTASDGVNMSEKSLLQQIPLNTASVKSKKNGTGKTHEIEKRNNSMQLNNGFGNLVKTQADLNLMSPKNVTSNQSQFFSQKKSALSTNHNTQGGSSFKSFPILASQLQSSALNQSISSHSMNQTTLRGENSLNYNTSSTFKVEDESSSEDEFEAIEPTIGFSTMLPVAPKIPSQNSFQRRGNSGITRPKSSLSSTSNKVLPAPKILINPGFCSSKTPVQSTTNSILPTTIRAISAPLPKKPNPPSAILTTTNSIRTTHSNFISKSLSSFPDNKLIISPSDTLKIISTPISSNNSVSVQTSTALSLEPNFTGVNPTRVFLPTTLPTKIIQGTSSGINHENNIVQVSRSISDRTNVIVAQKPNVAHLPFERNHIASGFTPNANTSSLSSNHLLESFNKSTSPCLPHIPTTLADWNLSLNLELDKLEDKIDDLPVLEGNPFDSISNLTDDLDVFDLDLVDGFCDLEVMLSDEKQYSSFFALIREVLCSTQNHRMTFTCLDKTVRKWATGTSSRANLWFNRLPNWNDALITALSFLAGSYQDIQPEDFVPYIEYKYKTKYYQWIGAGRDNDNNLLTLCNMWLDNLDKLPIVKKQEGDNEDQEEEEDENEDSDEHTEEVKKKYLRPKTPPPPRFVTDWTVRPSNLDEKEEFQAQERVRFDNPHKAFTYRMHSYESVVGPVKGVYSNQTGVTNKARGHSLLVDDRPPYVTILALVRDSVARLPNGEGTRSEICELLRDSAFLAPEASNTTLNSVVSGALDRLHYERDPCVRYDSHKKNWIYLHRDRSQEQFERLHHNRSYTKSTKSRSSNNRKSRKKSQSSITVLSSTSSTSDVSCIRQTNFPLSQNTANQPNTALVNSNLVSVKKVSGLGTFEGIVATTSSTTLGKAATTPPVVLTSTTASSNPPTMQFSLPSASATGSKVWMTQDSFLKTSILASSQTQNQGNIPSFAAGIASSSATTQASYIASVAEEFKSSPSLAPNASGSTAQKQNILVNNVLRIPNLKLPDNVRIMRIQQSPSTQITPGNQPLRVPQQRIVLRPGQVAGQAVILGQTATGQTVIISALGSPQIVNPQTNTLQTSEIKPSVFHSTATLAPPSTVVAISSDRSGSAATSTILVSKGITSTSSLTLVSTQSAPIVSPSSCMIRLASGTVVNSNIQTVPHASNVNIPMTTPVGGLLASPIFAQNLNQKMMRLSTMESIGNTKLSSSVVTSKTTTDTILSGSTGSNPSVLIRSNQGEYLIPGNQIALGRGSLQGYKMIPVSSGNQIFAKVVTPGSSSVQNETFLPHVSSQINNVTTQAPI